MIRGFLDGFLLCAYSFQNWKDLLMDEFLGEPIEDTEFNLDGNYDCFYDCLNNWYYED